MDIIRNRQAECIRLGRKFERALIERDHTRCGEVEARLNEIAVDHLGMMFETWVVQGRNSIARARKTGETYRV